MIKIGNLTFLVKAYCFPAVAGEGEGGVIVRPSPNQPKSKAFENKFESLS